MPGLQKAVVRAVQREDTDRERGKVAKDKKREQQKLEGKTRRLRKFWAWWG